MRSSVLFVAALVVLGTSASLVAGSNAGGPSAVESDTAAALGAQDNESAANDTSMPPGAQLAGVVNVQGAEVEGEIQQRSFGLQLAAAESNRSKAAVVATQTNDLRNRLSVLQERRQALLAANENGTISQARFRAEMAGLSAEISALQGLSNATADIARQLPPEDLEASGVDVTAVEEVQTDASNLSGPDISDAVSGVTGPPENGSDGLLGGDDDDGLLDGDGLPGNVTTTLPGNGTDDGDDGLLTNVTDGTTDETTTTDDGILSTVTNATDELSDETTDLLGSTTDEPTTTTAELTNATDGTTDETTTTDDGGLL